MYTLWTKARLEYFRGVNVAGAYGWQSYHVHVPSVLRNGILNLLEPLGPVQGLLYLIYVHNFRQGGTGV
jgi:hypothetical protein